MSTQTETSAAERARRIDALDLEPIKFKLMHTDDGAGWTLERADAAEVEYKRFLVLNLKYPDHSNVPTHDVDTFWHYHILDTMKYAEDCEHVLGRFLHHFPYVGLQGEEDALYLATAFEETQALYRAEFDVPVISGVAAQCDAGSHCAPPQPCDGKGVQGRVRPRPLRPETVN